MTKINDYLWQLPHDPMIDDPPEIGLLQGAFNAPIVALLRDTFAEIGYHLNSSDVVVKLDGRLDNTQDTYYANVRFIHYVQPDVLVRVHFEHAEWAHFLPQHAEHQFFINLDRFKVSDPATQIVVPAWTGRLHTRMSNLAEYVLEHKGDDQIWRYSSQRELEDRLTLFWEKFIHLGRDWLEDLSRVRE
ncbi:MAG: hypothetical protein JXB30_04995 [Anaerolineae bacterium]|nr:hypothetical protein [Anaerolineae bacterium]